MSLEQWCILPVNFLVLFLDNTLYLIELSYKLHNEVYRLIITSSISLGLLFKNTK